MAIVTRPIAEVDDGAAGHAEGCLQLPVLVEDAGLAFVGLDVVDGHLTEINVTSPTGLRQLVDLGGGRSDLDVVAWIERRVEQDGRHG